MAAARKFKAKNPDLEEAKRYIRSSGSGYVSRSYFKKSGHSVENTEIDSRGLYYFEKMVRFAFVQAMQDDVIFGRQDGFISYITSLSDSFETPIIKDWHPPQSAARVCDFMISFYDLYEFQWQKQGRLPNRSLICFLDIMHDCLDFSYIALSEKFNSLPRDIKDTVNKAFFLSNETLDEWYKERSSETQTA